MTPVPFSVVACGVCGLGRTVYAADAPDPSTTYPSDYAFHHREEGPATARGRSAAERRARASGSLAYWRWCDPRYADFGRIRGVDARVLDVGCGSGRFLRRFRELGWRAQGIEPSGSAAALARADGFDVEESSIEAAHPAVGAFDLVFLHHSFEHSDDPARAMATCASALRPGATIALALCNFDAPGVRFFEGAWPPLEIPRHRFHYTPTSARRLLDAHGVEPTEVHFQNHLGDLMPAFRNLRALSRARRSGDRLVPRSSPRRPGGGFAPRLTSPYLPILHAVRSDPRPSFLLLGRRRG